VPPARIQTDRSSIAGHAAGIGRVVALVADESQREAIGATLEEQELDFVAFDDAGELLGHDLEHAPPLVLLWVERTTPFPTQQVELLRRLERTAIVVVCADIQRWEMRAALADGVTGVVLEDELADTLVPCLRAVQVGHICVPRRHWRQIEPPALSSREKQILGLVVMGYMNGQIAERLFLAESTVKSHLSSAFGKLGVRSRNEAVELIIDPERGLGMGILALGGEPLEAAPSASE
jgi:DNA-binding NarL/FixJ family response regulator